MMRGNCAAHLFKESDMCKNMVDQIVPTRWSAKIVTLRCGSTSIYGDTLLCDECIAAGVPNPPAWQREDAGDLDREPFNADEYYFED